MTACEEKSRLTAEHQVATESFSKSVNALREKMGTSSIEEYERLQLARAWRRMTWREVTNATLASRFAVVRVRPAHRDYNRTTPRLEEWCLIEWPKGEPEPTKYWLSTLPARMSRRALVDITRRFVSPPMASSSSSGLLFPLRRTTRLIPPDISIARKLSTERRPRSGLSGMSAIRSRQCVALSPGPSREHSSAARAVNNQGCATVYDTVRLSLISCRFQIATVMIACAKSARGKL
jgi:hypothetical protein